MRDATHVVAGVLYGADALMEFQETAGDDSKKQDVKLEMSVMLNKIPFIDVSAKGSVNISDEEKKKVKNFSCRFYGDFGLKNLPSTFEEAVKAYKELPSLLGEKGEKAVPVKVWLYPLSKLGNFEDKLKRMISDLLVSQAEKMIDDFHQAGIRTNDLLGKSKAIKAKDIVYKLEQFQSCLRIFTTEMLRKMAELIPAIREGKREEAVLRDLLRTQKDSGFSGKDMEKWLDEKETEINTLTLHLKKLKYEIKPPGRELDMFLADPDVIDAFVFSFTSLSYEEPYLKKISQEADNFKTGTLPSTHEQHLANIVPWYLKPDVKEAMYSSLNIFNKAPTNNKVISYISDPKYPGASVRWYRNAVLMKPQVKNILQLSTMMCVICYVLRVDSCELTLDRNTAHKHVLLSNDNKVATCVNWDQPYPDNPARYRMSASVASIEPLTGRHYFECEWGGVKAEIGVLCKSSVIDKIWGELGPWFGHSEKTCCLTCYIDKYTFSCLKDNNFSIDLPPRASRRIGVYVDAEADTVSFYTVSSDTLTHLYTYTTTFPVKPLYAAFNFTTDDCSVVLCKVT
ncbi:hypothetical protein ACEWY4_018742 [Coilia grayii]|uniref:B30.2/SPRY domain-containing protein n=1 Tax=Coilia grayii TaxID=363190 RepID=A0ABD1JED3_9TELE